MTAPPKRELRWPGALQRTIRERDAARAALGRLLSAIDHASLDEDEYCEAVIDAEALLRGAPPVTPTENPDRQEEA